MKDGFIAPKITNDTKVFWSSCKVKELKIPLCNNCHNHFWPAGAFCPNCHLSDITFSSVTGKGKVHSFVVFRHEFDPQLFESLPYVVAVIDLAEGVKIISNIINCDIKDIFIEMQVQLTWKSDGEFCIPQFEPYKEK